MKTKAFSLLKHQYDAGKELVLWDYDGYDYLSMGMSLKDVLNNPDRPMGHAFVLASLIQEEFKIVKKNTEKIKDLKDDSFQERS